MLRDSKTCRRSDHWRCPLSVVKNATALARPRYCAQIDSAIGSRSWAAIAGVTALAAATSAGPISSVTREIGTPRRHCVARVAPDPASSTEKAPR
ncbi:MAG: hypothetical protein M5U28_22595 [Sandaracinaceae bacterium]|nr:hypothetical protein [Sandaracinaceae bacterium]